MKGLIQNKYRGTALLFVTLISQFGCANSPTVIPMAMIGIASLSERGKSAVIEPRKLNFIFEYKQVELSREQRNQLLYLYDWQHGAIISYGKAKAENDYTGLFIGHKRVQAVSQALAKNQVILQVNYDPTLAEDSVVVKENIVQTTRIATDKKTDLVENSRL
ncbi:hypothetical protein HWV01_10520 [Moritella sp. 5]|uniref:hypothetical protein n=1 Tax=Moritella sp. 5 TaxID=2746231 RepID=UPI001BA52D9B|nr:hypothetical protein [Moritella sp. 5]QUM80681.1 hypothetical protein HWV01_10520 [Moritella sp. 5]